MASSPRPSPPLARPAPVHAARPSHSEPRSTRSSVHSIRSLPTAAPRPPSTYTTHTAHTTHTLPPARPTHSSTRHHSDSSGNAATDSDKASRSPSGWKAYPADGSDTDVYHSTYSDQDYEDDDATVLGSHKVGQALLHLSLTAPFLSLAITLYTVVVLLYAVLAAPLRLVIHSRPTLRFAIASHLAGPLRLQLRCVHAPTTRAVVYDEEKSHRRRHHQWLADGPTLPHQSDLADRLLSLILTHLVAPLVALPIAFAAWIVLIFWALSAIINDEGTSGDGKSLALTVIDWWRWYLEGRMFR